MTPMIPLKYVVSLNRETLPETTDPNLEFKYIDIGSVSPGGRIAIPEDLVRFDTAPSRARRIAPEGAAVVSTVRTYLRAIASVPSSQDPLVFSTGFAVLEAGPELDPRFLIYACQSEVFITEVIARSVGVSYPAINSGDLAEIPIPVPPIEEQRRIADFLDDQVGRIDEAIATRQVQESLMLERATRLTSDVLTGAASVGPTVLADWVPFGRVPGHWSQRQLRGISCTVETGPFGTQLHADEYVDSGWPVINPANIQNGELVPSPGVYVDDSTGERLSRHRLMVGDVIFGRRGELGRAALVTPEAAGWLCGTGCLLVRIKDTSVLPEYLTELLGTDALKYYFTSVSVGSTMSNLNTGILLSMPLLVPPLDEQHVILARARDIDALASATTSNLRQSIAGLYERKRALITAAVTGQIDVTTTRTLTGPWVSPSVSFPSIDSVPQAAGVAL